MTSPTKQWAPILALCLVVGLGLHWLLQSRVDPRSGPPVVTIDVSEGMSFQEVARLLDEQGVINSRMGFVLLGKLTLAARRILPGEYAFHGGMRPLHILSDLQNGNVLLHQVTIPEGFSVAQIAHRLAGEGLANEKEFLLLAKDPAFIQALELDVRSLEGYLFPTTYRFAKYSKPENMIRTMVAFMSKAVTPDRRARAAELGMSVHEVLTLASVIEKETGAAEERRLISAVFHNRLRRKIPLQSDPTVIYALEGFDGNLRKRDLGVDSPYNTYRVRGLPPGPIANPGLESILAALYPAKASYLYFVSRNDGTHHFSSTLAEHNRAVDKYQRKYRRRAARRVS